MGGRRAVASGRKVKGGQIRLDQMLTPRRSSRRSSSLLEKPGSSGSKAVEVELTDDSQEFEIGDKGKTVILLTKDDPSKKARSSAEKKTKGVKKGSKISKEDQREMLKVFDLNPAYGPCRGISRRERYVRAMKYGIQPAPEKLILEILDEHGDDFTVQSCIWDQNELLKLHV